MPLMWATVDRELKTSKQIKNKPENPMILRKKLINRKAWRTKTICRSKHQVRE